jgi:hypothetical protein
VWDRFLAGVQRFLSFFGDTVKELAIKIAELPKNIADFANKVIKRAGEVVDKIPDLVDDASRLFPVLAGIAFLLLVEEAQS